MGLYCIVIKAYRGGLYRISTKQGIPLGMQDRGQWDSPLKRQQSVWVAAPSDEVHSTQELLEVRQGSQGLGRVGETRESRGVQSLQD